jgi:hypothetical protein
MDTKNYNDNTYNLIKLWHNLIKYNKEKRSINKMNSFDYTNSLLKKSSGNLFNLQCLNYQKMKRNKSFNIQRTDFYSNYNVII